ncbi:MAG: PHP domain-containing protein [Chloroflexi bacterium]|nr:PHP domain-containing protein [Chloroflexota bacterium]MCI0783205.1 PHP domain-containing protein [Chloroflexota bacterium]MCI0814484.1 PHP domain-containing protein [Chloroflexota bacterium]MCI0817651.1 PHP domain-containing protein [Chloroflexota bacterium]MCI0819299.1 PHP domain-containing protein [Chloroflexota bacterium]
MAKADLHIHTSHSDGMYDVSELLDYVESETDLDLIAVTDHDSLSGAWEARERCARGRFRFDVIPGMEVTTIEGHVLALFVEDPPPSLRPVEETLAAIHRLGGLAVVPHPFTWLTRGMGLRHLRRILASRTDGVHIDAIEVTNQTPAGRLGARKARRLNRDEFGLAEAGGSDAHFLPVIGTAYTEFAGENADDLRAAIAARATRGVTGRHPSLREIGYAHVVRQTYRGILATPRAMGWGPTARSFVQRIASVR